jgi:hypothetical protein
MKVKPRATHAASPDDATPRQRAAARPASKPEPEPSAPAEPPPEPEPAAAAAPATPTPAPAKPATRVVVPSTAHVRADVPAGLQRWLDADPRMQPWLTKVMNVIDGCYRGQLADRPNLAGAIRFKLTMHENARPDADIEDLPSQLSGVVACATGQLMRARMPLFTGTEGERYTARVHFTP